MSHDPFTLQEAIAVCDAHKDLKGTVRVNEKTDFEVIEDIVVTPYNHICKQIFFTLYREMNCPFMAIKFYKGPEYDVVVILRELVPVGKGEMNYMDIQNYLEEIDSPVRINFLKEV